MRLPIGDQAIPQTIEGSFAFLRKYADCRACSIAGWMQMIKGLMPGFVATLLVVSSAHAADWREASFSYDYDAGSLSHDGPLVFAVLRAVVLETEEAWTVPDAWYAMDCSEKLLFSEIGINDIQQVRGNYPQWAAKGRRYDDLSVDEKEMIATICTHVGLWPFSPQDN